MVVYVGSSTLVVISHKLFSTRYNDNVISVNLLYVVILLLLFLIIILLSKKKEIEKQVTYIVFLCVELKFLNFIVLYNNSDKLFSVILQLAKKYLSERTTESTEIQRKLSISVDDINSA